MTHECTNSHTAGVESVKKISPDLDALLSEAEAGSLCNISRRTLANWRLRGDGPPFVKAGRAVRYRRRDLISWIESRTVHSTSDKGL